MAKNVLYIGMESLAFIAEEKQEGFYITSFKHSSSVKGGFGDCTVGEFNTILLLASEAIKEIRRSALDQQ